MITVIFLEYTVVINSKNAWKVECSSKCGLLDQYKKNQNHH